MCNPTNNHPDEIVFHEYLDDELPPSERENFESHLSKCQKCAQALSTLEELFTQIDSLQPIEFINDISPSVIKEINHFIRIEPLIKRTAWVQISIILILMVALFSLVSMETIQSSISNAFSNLGESIATNVSTITEFFDSLPNQFPNLEFQSLSHLSLFTADYLSITLLSTITIVSGLLWFIGNKILLPNSIITHSSNGG